MYASEQWGNRGHTDDLCALTWEHRTDSVRRLHAGKPARLLAAIWVGMLGTLTMAPANAVDVPDAGRVLETTKDQPQPPVNKPPPALDVQSESKPALQTPTDFQMTLTAFRITGTTAYAEQQLLPLLQDHIGKSQTFGDLEQAAAAITRFYRLHGYPVARAYLPQQEINNGIVEIAVLEGRVGAVELELHGNRHRISTDQAHAIVTQSIKTGEVIRQDELERGLLLLNDLPTVQVKSTLQPGASVGTSDLIVDATVGSLLDGSVDVDTFGNRFTGEFRFGGTLNLNSPAGFSDLLSLRGLTTGSDLKYGRLSYVVPVNSLGTKLGAAYSYVDFNLGKELSALDAKGNARVASVFALHPFIRSRRFSLYGSVGFDKKNYRNTAISQTTSDKEADVWLLGVTAETRDGLGGGGLNRFDLNYAHGALDLNDSPDKEADALTAKTHGRFDKLNVDFTRLQGITERISLRLALSGQLASKNLDSAEQFVLGGPFGVRAFPQGEGSGDEGYLASVELRWEWVNRRIPGDVQFAGFVDSGRVTLHKREWSGWQGSNPSLPNSYRLSGAGIGVNWGQFENYLLQASMAWKLGSNPGRDADGRDSDNTDRNGRFWMQLMKWF